MRLAGKLYCLHSAARSFSVVAVRGPREKGHDGDGSENGAADDDCEGHLMSRRSLG